MKNSDTLILFRIKKRRRETNREKEAITWLSHLLFTVEERDKNSYTI